MAENAKVIMKKMTRTAPISGLVKESTSFLKMPPFEFDGVRVLGFVWPIDSGRKKNTNRKFNNVRRNAAKPGAQYPYGTKNPPIADPIMKPAP